MNERWVAVFNGPTWEALAVQAQLEGEGIATLVPNRETRVMDPFVTGGDAFSLEVMVPASMSASALTILQPNDLASEPAVVADSALRLAKLGLRIRWAAVMTVTAPLALVMGVIYLARVRKLGERPAEHGWNVAAIALAAAFTLAFVTEWGAMLFSNA